jgi:hypothetical protein
MGVRYCYYCRTIQNTDEKISEDKEWKKTAENCSVCHRFLCEEWLPKKKGEK